MTRQLGIALTIVALTLGCGTAAASFDAADQATLAKHVLTADELNRLTAVMEDAKAHGHAPSVNMAGAGSLDALAAKADKEPGVHALLVVHGFTARDYVVAALNLKDLSFEKGEPALIIAIVRAIAILTGPLVLAADVGGPPLVVSLERSFESLTLDWTRPEQDRGRWQRLLSCAPGAATIS